MIPWYYSLICVVHILPFDVHMGNPESPTAHNFAVVGSITMTFNFRRCAKSICELISICEYNIKSTAVSHLSNTFIKLVFDQSEFFVQKESLL